MSGKSRRNNKGTRIILNVILVIAILCFLGSGGYLLKYYWDGWQAEKKVSALEDMILDDHMTVPDGSAGQTGDAGEGTADGQIETEEPGAGTGNCLRPTVILSDGFPSMGQSLIIR